jgi:hypothetical protein
VNSEFDCSTFTKKSECKDFDECNWRGKDDYCYSNVEPDTEAPSAECGQFTIKNGCLNDGVGCRWNGKLDYCYDDAPEPTELGFAFGTTDPYTHTHNPATTPTSPTIPAPSPPPTTAEPATDVNSELDCSAFTKKSDCKDFDECNWHGKDDYCYSNVEPDTEAPSAEGDAGCTATTKSDCITDDSCKWHGKDDYCYSVAVTSTAAPPTGCAANTKRSACISIEGCRWKGSGDYCYEDEA